MTAGTPELVRVAHARLVGLGTVFEGQVVDGDIPQRACRVVFGFEHDLVKTAGTQVKHKPDMWPTVQGSVLQNPICPIPDKVETFPASLFANMRRILNQTACIVNLKTRTVLAFLL